MAIQASGRDFWAKALGSITNGYTSTVNEFIGAQELKRTGAGWAVGQFVGQDVYVGNRVGTITANTEEVLTVARWEDPSARGAASPASTPGGTPAFSISAGQAPAQWMAVTENETVVTIGGADTSLPEEINKAGGGLNRGFATYGHTTGTNVYTLTKQFTKNGSDKAGAVKLAKLGILNAQNGGILVYETFLSSVAELKEVGDKVEITETVTGT
jgi:hypothetical protein